jgi:predicted Zn finger-like uncharacterized protein
MVISCPECSTRFRVDENRIPERGAKIRCARCKHIFAVVPPTTEPENIREEPFSIPEEPPAWEAPSAPGATVSDFDAAASSDFDAAAEAPRIQPPSAPQETDFGNIRDDFGFDGFNSDEIGEGDEDELDSSSPKGFDQQQEDSNDFSFGEEYGNVNLGEEDASSLDEASFSFGEPISAPAENKADLELPNFNDSPSARTAPPTPDPLTEVFTEDPDLATIVPPPAAEEFRFAKPEAPIQPASPKAARKSPLSMVILFFLMLILAILIAVGVLVWKSGPEGLEKVISAIANRASATEVKGDIRLTNLQGSFITNRKEGELFVVQGVAINDLKEARAAIQVKGIIFDKEGKQLMQKTIFCGNPISDHDLRTLTYSKMEELMGNQFGESLANLNVTRGQSIPFTIVFRKLPKTLSEFVVEVADSKPAAQ